MKEFLAELKRRNVYKVAVAYAVIAWLLIQAGSILFPTFDAPGFLFENLSALASTRPIPARVRLHEEPRRVSTNGRAGIEPEVCPKVQQQAVLTDLLSTFLSDFSDSDRSWATQLLLSHTFP